MQPKCNISEFFNNQLQNSEMYKFFRDHVIRSIDKRDEEKLKNKIFLEKILILCKKIKKSSK